MRFYPVKTPRLVRKQFPKFTWKGKDSNVYLTFDDGPTADFNSRIIEILGTYGVKATFFCVGGNLKKNRSEAEKLLEHGHKISNHTYNHLNGWKTDNTEYLDNVEKCQSEISDIFTPNKLFRPPYGRIKKSQAKPLMDAGYQVIMWDVLSGDFDKGTSADKCLSQTLSNTEEGSIVVFHDNKKSYDKVDYVLPRYIEQLIDNGYKFAVL